MKYGVCNFPVPGNPKRYLFLFSVFWLVGFYLGTFVGSVSGISSSLMLRSSFGSLSIVGLISVIFFPLFVLAFAIYVRRYPLLLLISFFKSFSYGFTSVLILLAFGDVHWFIKGILMFSSTGCSVVFCVLIYRLITGAVTSRSILSGAIWDVLFGLADFWFVAPLLSASGLF